MPSKFLRELANERNVPVTKLLATTLGIYQPTGIKVRLDSAVREQGYTIAKSMGIVYKNEESRAKWDGYLSRCVNEIDALKSIKNKFSAWERNNKRYPEVHAALDEFLSETLRRRRVKQLAQLAEPTRRSRRKRAGMWPMCKVVYKPNI